MTRESRRSADEPTRASAAAVFVVSNDLSSLCDARQRVRAHLQSFGVGEGVLHAVELTLEELAGNVVRHGYARSRAGEIRIEVALLPDRVLITILDDACAFDPTAHPEPAPFRSVGDAPIGGRGISMVRKIADAMRYARVGERNCTEVEIACDRGAPPSR